MINKDKLMEVTNVASFIQNKMPWSIICKLADGEACVKEIAQALYPDCTKKNIFAKISNNLNTMARMGFLDVRKEGKKVFYSVSDRYINFVNKLITIVK